MTVGCVGREINGLGFWACGLGFGVELWAQGWGSESIRNRSLVLGFEGFLRNQWCDRLCRGWHADSKVSMPYLSSRHTEGKLQPLNPKPYDLNPNISSLMAYVAHKTGASNSSRVSDPSLSSSKPYWPGVAQNQGGLGFRVQGLGSRLGFRVQG